MGTEKGRKASRRDSCDDEHRSSRSRRSRSTSRSSRSRRYRSRSRSPRRHHRSRHSRSRSRQRQRRDARSRSRSRSHRSRKRHDDRHSKHDRSSSRTHVHRSPRHEDCTQDKEPELKDAEKTLPKDPVIDKAQDRSVESSIGVEASENDVKDELHSETTSNTKDTASPASTKIEPTTSVPLAQSKVDVSGMKEDIMKALAQARSTLSAFKKPSEPPVEAPAEPPVQKTPATVDEFDMFAAAESSNLPPLPSGPVNMTQHSNGDDADGYYQLTIGEVLNGKYRVLGAAGKGVFSTVLKCEQIAPWDKKGDLIAVKLIRNNEVMKDAAQTEMKILQKLAEKDVQDKKHCIRLLETFEHRGHVALVFPRLKMNVREAMRKFGGKSGISIQAVRVFAKQLLIALSLLQSCRIVHGDIKPDNILLDETQSNVRLCDFGSAFQVDEKNVEPTPYLVSRFYRAPEITLGLAYDTPVDMWSIGCCLYEMFTGQVLFPGSTNNEMLKYFMSLKGKVPAKMIRKHRTVFVEQFETEPHFDEDLAFCSRESDQITGKPVLRVQSGVKVTMDLHAKLMQAKTSTDDRKLVTELKSLLDKMLHLDPMKRLSVRDALAHPFLRG